MGQLNIATIHVSHNQLGHGHQNKEEHHFVELMRRLAKSECKSKMKTQKVHKRQVLNIKQVLMILATNLNFAETLKETITVKHLHDLHDCKDLSVALRLSVDLETKILLLYQVTGYARIQCTKRENCTTYHI